MARKAAAATTQTSPYTVAARQPGAEAGTTDQQSAWSLTSDRVLDRTSLGSEFDGEADAERLSTQMQRELVRRTPPEERARYYDEHGRLTEKEFREGLSVRERTRLQYVQWQLDRFEDADIGDRLDDLGDIAALHRSIAEEVKNFAEHAESAAKNRGRARR